VVPRAERELERRDEALRLRLGGYTYRQIAEVMGLSPTAVSNMITRALEQAPNEKAVAQRAIENARLDRLQAAVWKDAINGDIKAIDAVLRISRRRSEMNGLDAPKKIDIRASVRHDVSRAVQELQEVLLGDVIEVDEEGNILEPIPDGRQHSDEDDDLYIEPFDG
jgi:predicted transcriptional regulator